MLSPQENRRFKIGEIYLMKFDGQANEQKGWRPGVIFQNNIGNAHSPNIIALPLTSSLKKVTQPTHVYIPADSETLLKKDSMVLCENPVCMSKTRVGAYITTLPEKYMSEIALANLLASSSIAFVNPEKLLVTWQKSLMLNSVRP